MFTIGRRAETRCNCLLGRGKAGLISRTPFPAFALLFRDDALLFIRHCEKTVGDKRRPRIPSCRPLGGVTIVSTPNDPRCALLWIGNQLHDFFIGLRQPNQSLLAVDFPLLDGEFWWHRRLSSHPIHPFGPQSCVSIIEGVEAESWSPSPRTGGETTLNELISLDGASAPRCRRVFRAVSH